MHNYNPDPRMYAQKNLQDPFLLSNGKPAMNFLEMTNL